MARPRAGLRAGAPALSPAPSQPSPGSGGPHAPEDAGALPPCAIFNTTFSLHRASPLFVGPDGLPAARLQALGHQLRDLLVADVVRGVEVGLDGGGDGAALASAGALEEVAVGWAAARSAVPTSRPALQTSLRFEHALCTAVFLPLPEAADPPAADGAAAEAAPFLHLPLLLLRMPTALKSVVVGFFSTAFDCRVVPLRLSSADIVHSWEAWARGTAVPTRGPLAKDAVLTLAFRLPEPRHPVAVPPAPPDAGAAEPPAAFGLKTIDIFVPNEDLRRFLSAGQQLSRTRAQPSSTPFMDALSRFVQQHLALDMANPAVAVVRVACGGFVLSENRAKIFAPPESSPDVYSGRHRAVVPQLLGDLAVRARG